MKNRLRIRELRVRKNWEWSQLLRIIKAHKPSSHNDSEVDNFKKKKEILWKTGTDSLREDPGSLRIWYFQRLVLWSFSQGNICILCIILNCIIIIIYLSIYYSFRKNPISVAGILQIVAIVVSMLQVWVVRLIFGAAYNSLLWHDNRRGYVTYIFFSSLSILWYQLSILVSVADFLRNNFIAILCL